MPAQIASMRPRLLAVDHHTEDRAWTESTKRFNEATAVSRGSRRAEALAINAPPASMRPRLLAVDHRLVIFFWR